MEYIYANESDEHKDDTRDQNDVESLHKVSPLICRFFRNDMYFALGEIRSGSRMAGSASFWQIVRVDGGFCVR